PFSAGPTTAGSAANFSLPNPAGAAVALVYLQQPTSTAAGQPITPAVRIGIVDEFNNLTNSTAAVTIVLATNPTGATLNGTLTVNAVGGVANFDNLNITKAGTGYTLSASSNGFTAIASNAFNITGGTAVKFVISAPTRVRTGIGFEVTITAQDEFGNVATGYLGTVSFHPLTRGLALPANQTFTAADAGVKRITVTARRVGFGMFIVKEQGTTPTIPSVAVRFWNLFGNRLLV
ncbi:MAG TPA: hypothetical protein PKD86_13705, partial [Gemmatales bacterium]|nr:hypothetical protein [Gemmatales bacterium]